MKRFIQVVSTVLLAISALTASAAAATTGLSCSIYNTGSDSFNSCIQNQNQDIQATCVNNVYVINSNSQSAGTGGANSSGNTGAGGAVTGSAVNENGTTVTLGASCAQASTVTTTPPPEVTTPPAQAVAATTTAPSPAPKVAVLPKTGENPFEHALTAAVVASGILGSASVAAVLYRRLAVK